MKAPHRAILALLCIIALVGLLALSVSADSDSLAIDWGPNNRLHWSTLMSSIENNVSGAAFVFDVLPGVTPNRIDISRSQYLNHRYDFSTYELYAFRQYPFHMEVYYNGGVLYSNTLTMPNNTSASPRASIRFDVTEGRIYVSSNMPVQDPITGIGGVGTLRLYRGTPYDNGSLGSMTDNRSLECPLDQNFSYTLEPQEYGGSFVAVLTIHGSTYTAATVVRPYIHLTINEQGVSFTPNQKIRGGDTVFLEYCTIQSFQSGNPSWSTVYEMGFGPQVFPLPFQAGCYRVVWYSGSSIYRSEVYTHFDGSKWPEFPISPGEYNPSDLPSVDSYPVNDMKNFSQVANYRDAITGNLQKTALWSLILSMLLTFSIFAGINICRRFFK